MGAAASTSNIKSQTSPSGASSTVLVHPPENLPDEIFVEGAGSVKANGRFTLLTDEKGFPIKNIFDRDCERRFWFTKGQEEGCWIGLVNARSRRKKKITDTNQDQTRWILFTSQAILYTAPIAGDQVAPPRQGRWEESGGNAPAPTVNLQPLPEAFLFSGFKGINDCLNGEYLPLDDGKRMNARPIFKHTPVMAKWAGQDRHRMHWSQGAWRICDKEQLESNGRQCIAFATIEVMHPTAMPAKTVWKGPASGNYVGSDLKFLEGVSIAAGTVRAVC